MPGYWDGRILAVIEKTPMVYRDQKVGIGTVDPRSELDTNLGVMSGAANDYQKAQLARTGGGTVTWNGPDKALTWTEPFKARIVGTGTATNGFVEIPVSSEDLGLGDPR